MLYVTGDTHGDFSRFNQIRLKEGDTLFICGDFGFLWNNGEADKNALDAMAELPYSICFCDGNHENFDLLDTYPVTVRNGGEVHAIRPNVIHLMRGNVFDFGGKRFFVMGGAYSTDKSMRTEGRSWWPQELPCAQEYKKAVASLENHQMQVDYILTHTAPSSAIRQLGMLPSIKDGELTGFLDWVMHEVRFEHWFFGHFHIERDINPNMSALYTNLRDIEA